MAQTEWRTGFWSDVGQRCNLSPEYAKHVAYAVMYGGSIDPWLDAIVTAALKAEQRKASPYARLY